MCFAFIPRAGRLFFIDRGRITDFDAVTAKKKKKKEILWQRPRESNREKKQTDELTESGLLGRIIRPIYYSACSLEQCLWLGFKLVVLVSLAVAGWEVSHWSANISWYFWIWAFIILWGSRHCGWISLDLLRGLHVSVCVCTLVERKMQVTVCVHICLQMWLCDACDLYEVSFCQSQALQGSVERKKRD